MPVANIFSAKSSLQGASTELDALQVTLNQTLDVIREEIRSQGLAELSNYAQEPHPLDDPNRICNPRLYEARRLALASIGQLKSLLQVPYEKVVETSYAVFDTACMDIFVQTGILDVLAETGVMQAGLHVTSICEQLDMDPIKVTTILRYLATQCWVYEREEGVFALLRASLELRRGMNGRKWSMTPGKPKIAQALKEQLTHPMWRHSRSSIETAFQLSHGTHLSVFEYNKQHPALLKQWASSVRTLGDVWQSAVINDYPWKSCAPKLIVDCGGGQGGLAIALTRMLGPQNQNSEHSADLLRCRLPNCRIVVQDLPEVIPLAEANMLTDAPLAVSEGYIVAEPHNFFETQPRFGDAAIFVFRYILHDWPDDDCVRILQAVMPVMNSTSKILLIDTISVPSKVARMDDNLIMSPTTLDELCANGHYMAITAPRYIPVNFGATAKMSQALSVHMMGLFNARERCFSEWKHIVVRAGLRISRVFKLRASISIIECQLP